jgi:transcriptional regulator with XRE-family HTH domain
MIKQKLKNFCEKKFTQEEFAHKIGMENSSYNRRENGVTKISKREWDTMAKALEVPLEEIYEPEDGVYIFHAENSTGNVGSNNNNVFNTLSEYAVETMKKYITKLEEENLDLKKKLNI